MDWILIIAVFNHSFLGSNNIRNSQNNSCSYDTNCSMSVNNNHGKQNQYMHICMISKYMYECSLPQNIYVATFKVTYYGKEITRAMSFFLLNEHFWYVYIMRGSRKNFQGVVRWISVFARGCPRPIFWSFYNANLGKKFPGGVDTRPPPPTL